MMNPVGTQHLLIDADDTLWENNIYFEDAFEEFVDYLKHSSMSAAEIRTVLDEIEGLPPPAGVMHCFGGDWETARRALDLGLYIGVDGPVTFRKSTDLQDLVRWLPLDRLLLETDSPYLSPHPFRGQPNEPGRLRVIAEKVAELKGQIEALRGLSRSLAFDAGQPDASVGVKAL